jgi:hypothetical protein
MFLQKFIKKTVYTRTTCTIWIYVSLMMFTINDLDYFHKNSDVHEVNSRAKHQLHRTNVNLSYIQKGVFYSSIMIFNNLPPSHILKLETEKKTKFKVALRSYLIAPNLYSMDKFFSTSQITFPLQHQ